MEASAVDPTDPDQALQLASLLPEERLSRLWLRAAGVSDECLDRLIHNAWLAPAGDADTLGWVDPAARRRVEQSLSPSVRQAHSLTLAIAARDLRLHPATTATYYEAAQRLEEARVMWLKAAERHCAAAQYPEALQSLGRALKLWPWTHLPIDRVRALKEAARCASNAGLLDHAGTIWRELTEFAADTGNAALEVESLGQLAACTSDAVEVSRCLRRAADLAVDTLPAAESVPVILSYVDHLASRVRLSAAGQALDQAVRLVEDCADPALLSIVRGWQGLVAAMAGQHDEAHLLVEESLRIALDHDLKEQAALAYRRRANICEYRGDYRGESNGHQQAIQYCQTHGASGSTTCLSCLAYACFRVGDWKEAISSARRVFRDPEAHPALQAIAHCVLGMIAAFRGERAPAHKHLHLALDRLRVDGLAGLEMFCLWALAYAHEMDGESAAATRCHDEVRALWRETEDVHDVIPALLFAGGHYAEAGRTDALADCLDILGTVERRNPIPEARAALALLRAESAALGGDLRRVEHELAGAVKQMKDADLPLEWLWVEYRKTRLLPESALASSTLQLAARLGLRPLLSRLQTPAVARATPGDLTGRQTDVLGGLARGLTSKEIANELGLSTRTVEMHVARLLERLNCRTRTEAVKLAVQRGWV